MNAWKSFWIECRLAVAEWLMWLAVEVLPIGNEKLEVGTFLIEYGKRRAIEMQVELYNKELARRRLQ